EDVSIALLIDQDTCRVLAPIIDAMRIAPHAPVDLVVHDAVVARKVHAEADPAEEGEIVVPDEAVIAFHQHEAALPTMDGNALYFEPVTAPQVDAGAVPQPLVFLILVVTHPVRKVFALQRACEALLPIVGKVTCENPQSRRIIGCQSD